MLVILLINHSMNEGSDVCSCLIDVSMAFDNVHWENVFQLELKTMCHLFSA